MKGLYPPPGNIAIAARNDAMEMAPNATVTANGTFEDSMTLGLLFSFILNLFLLQHPVFTRNKCKFALCKPCSKQHQSSLYHITTKLTHLPSPITHISKITPKPAKIFTPQGPVPRDSKCCQFQFSIANAGGVKIDN
jgi:hypothetical protein